MALPCNHNSLYWSITLYAGTHFSQFSSALSLNDSNVSSGLVYFVKTEASHSNGGVMHSILTAVDITRHAMAE